MVALARSCERGFWRRTLGAAEWTFHNNTSPAFTVSNLSLAKDGCVSVKANCAARMSLSTDDSMGGASLFSVSGEDSSKQSNFAGRYLSQLHSGSRGSPLSRGCDIAVRLDSDDLICWVNSSGAPKLTIQDFSRNDRNRLCSGADWISRATSV